MRTIFLLAVSAFIVFLSAPAYADWDPGEPYKMHYPQLPDLEPTGLDVLAGFGPIATPSQIPEKFLADDWKCSFSGLVTDIHIWGSFNEDIPIGLDAAGAVPYLSLVIYSDVPAGADTDYSHPGEPLWDMYLQPTRVRQYPDDGFVAQEGFYDPNQNMIIGQDTQVWQFNFDIPKDRAFWQDEGTIYWLGVHYSFDLNGDGIVDTTDLITGLDAYPGAFGWKTSLDHFNDDAVWTDVFTFGGDPHVVPSDIPGTVPIWRELRYPFGHPFETQSMDLSFVITGIPEPATAGLLGIGLIALVGCRRGRR